MLATNTLHAYNYWGGASAYCDVAALMSRREDAAEAMAGAHRRALDPAPVPAAAARRRRRTCRGWSTCASAASRSGRWAGDRDWPRAPPAPLRRLRRLPQQVGARLRRAGRKAEGLALDYLTDYDLEAEPSALDAYGVRRPGRPQRILVGAAARRRSSASSTRRPAGDLLRQHRLLEGALGGRRRARFICHKWQGFERDPRRRRASRSGDAPVVAPGVRAAGGRDHRPQLPLRRLSSAGPLRRARAPAATRSTTTALGAGRLRPLLRRRDRRRASRCSATRTTAAASPSTPTAARAGRRRSACRRTWRSSPWPRPRSARRPAAATAPLIPPEKLPIVARESFGDDSAAGAGTASCAATR